MKGVQCDAETFIGRCPAEATHRQGILRDCDCDGLKVANLCEHHTTGTRHRCRSCDQPIRATEAVRLRVTA